LSSLGRIVGCTLSCRVNSSPGFDTKSVVYRYSQTLLAANIAFGGLHRDMPEKKLDLLKLAARIMAETRTGPPEIMWCETWNVHARGRLLWSTLSRLCAWRAYLATQRGAEAAAKFQKILDHRGIVVSDPVGALARLELGRAYALSGDKAKARHAYQDFLTQWKDADPEIPILNRPKPNTRSSNDYGSLLRGAEAFLDHGQSRSGVSIDVNRANHSCREPSD
jgi:hypothetical protein